MEQFYILALEWKNSFKVAFVNKKNRKRAEIAALRGLR
ncbi:hypothetical protein LEP1GSC012_0725 [Leptospira interrogans serovar Valbuzzi str. Valbuzzi]|nr:hypothetical protein LEP1GSC012_0725 [Leptospira interrogans serovar Valbuzzi str. Valbuzzi]